MAAPRSMPALHLALLLCLVQHSMPALASDSPPTSPASPSCQAVLAGSSKLTENLYSVLNYLSLSLVDASQRLTCYNHFPSPYTCSPFNSPDALHELLLRGGPFPKWEPACSKCNSKVTYRDLHHKTKDHVHEIARELNILPAAVEGSAHVAIPPLRPPYDKLLPAYYSQMCEKLTGSWKYTPRIQKLLSYEQAYLQTLPQPIIAINTEVGPHHVSPEGADHDAGAVHARLKNISRAAVTASIQSYTKGVERLQQRFLGQLNGTCVITGDTFEVAQAIKAVAEKVLKCVVVMWTLPGSEPITPKAARAKPQAARCTLAMGAIVEAELLAASSFSIGSVGHNSNNMAYLLRRCLHKKPEGTFVDVAGRDFGRVYMMHSGRSRHQLSH